MRNNNRDLWYIIPYMHIAIDARFLNSGTGTYGVKLLEYLQQIDKVNQYSVIVKAKDAEYWQPTNPNFTLHPVDFAFYSFAEQLGLKKFLDDLAPDLVHFAMPQQPILYAGKRITTMHDLTLLNTYNSDKNWLVFHAKQLVGRFVFKRIARISDHIIAISENTKREYQAFTPIPEDKISVIYEAAEARPGKLQSYNVPFKEFIMYVGQQPDYKNLRRLAEAHQLLRGNRHLLHDGVDGNRPRHVLGQPGDRRGRKRIEHEAVPPRFNRSCGLAGSHRGFPNCSCRGLDGN